MHLHPSVSTEARQLLGGTGANEASFSSELVDLVDDSMLKRLFDHENDLGKFWINLYQFPTLRQVAIYFLTMFGSTYMCESSFSHMNSIKTKQRKQDHIC